MKRNIEVLIRKNLMVIIATAIIICILGIGGFIAYRSMIKPGYTDVFFNMESDLPESSAALKYGKVGDKDALNIMETGKTYNMEFSVNSKEKATTSYRYVIDSKVKKQEDTFALKPGENKTIKVTISPGESDKWTFDRTDSTSTSNTFDLTNDSWLGERIDYEILADQNTKAYTYAPIILDLGEFKKALNLNLTLEGLKTTPYHKQYTTTASKTDEKDAETNEVSMSVKNNQLFIDLKTTTQVYKTKPDILKITVYKDSQTDMDRYKPKPIVNNITSTDTLDNNHNPASISFWYQIR